MVDPVLVKDGDDLDNIGGVEPPNGAIQPKPWCQSMI